MSKEELNYDELEKVSGGFSQEKDTYLPGDHGPIINRNDLNNRVGSGVYVVKHGKPESFAWGTIAKAEKKPYLYIVTVNIEGLSELGKTDIGYDIGSQGSFKELEFTFYSKN